MCRPGKPATLTHKWYWRKSSPLEGLGGQDVVEIPEAGTLVFHLSIECTRVYTTELTPVTVSTV